MNQFDENEEFVRRPNTSAGNASPQPQRPVSNAAPRTYSETVSQRRIARPVQPGGQNAGARRPASAQPIRTAPKVPTQSNTAQRQATQRQSTQNNTVQRQAAQRISTARPQSAPYSAPKKAAEPKKPTDKKALILNVVIFLLMLAALIGIGSAVMLSTLKTTPEKEKADFTFVYDIGDEKKMFTSVTLNRVAYMNMTLLSDECGFTVSGTKACLRYTADKGEYVEFTVGSVSARINGDIVNMEGAALVRGGNVWIPLAFAENYFGGLVFTPDEEKNTLSVSRAVKSTEADGSIIYEDITFRVKGSVSIPGIDEDPSIGDIVTPTFKNDLSEYEQYMDPEDRDAYLILVNKTHTIDSESIPDSLVPIENTRTDRAKEQMVECAEKALEAMYLELKGAGYTDVSVTSGYRSYNKQVSLFNTYLQNEMSNNPSLSEEAAKEIVLTYSAFPGTSEHQTGLCCDMHNLPSADIAFANKPAYTWLIENCYKFGFILRFPEDKVELTGYSFEPWHYRFVGRYHATRMHDLGMCLEEYTEYLAKIKNS